MRSSLEPVFCSSTVVSGSGFLQVIRVSVPRKDCPEAKRTDHFCVGFVSWRMTVALGSSSHRLKKMSATSLS